MSINRLLQQIFMKFQSFVKLLDICRKQSFGTKNQKQSSIHVEIQKVLSIILIKFQLT